jgi:S1-C subfamily serine protease
MEVTFAMTKSVLRQFHLALLPAGAALFLALGSMPVRAQDRPAPPFAQTTEASGWLGVSIGEVSAQKAQELKLPGAYGVLVAEVGADSPAAKAGLKNGDAITDYNGQRVEGAAEFRRLVRETPPGRTVKLTVWRDGRSQTISAEVGRNQSPDRENPFQGPFQGPFQSMMRRFGNPDSAPALPREPGNRRPNTFGFGATPPASPVLGITGQDLSGQLGKYFGAPDGEGILITNVGSDSAAAKAGLQAGDVITKMDGDRVRTLGELRGRLRDKHDAKSVTLSVLRKGSELSVNVEPRKRQSPNAAPAIPL